MCWLDCLVIAGYKGIWRFIQRPKHKEALRLTEQKNNLQFPQFVSEVWNGMELKYNMEWNNILGGIVRLHKMTAEIFAS